MEAFQMMYSLLGVDVWAHPVVMLGETMWAGPKQELSDGFWMFLWLSFLYNSCLGSYIQFVRWVLKATYNWRVPACNPWKLTNPSASGTLMQIAAVQF